MLSRTCRLAALAMAGAVAAACTLIAGCSPSQVYGCTAVSLSVQDSDVGRITDDLPLTAALTAHGEPVADQLINFWLFYEGLGHPSGAGVFVGTKPTGPDGVARLTIVGGPAGPLLSGAAPTGFGAEKPLRDDYCGASTKARLLCGSTPSGSCPPVGKPTE